MIPVPPRPDPEPLLYKVPLPSGDCRGGCEESLAMQICFAHAKTHETTMTLDLAYKCARISQPLGIIALGNHVFSIVRLTVHLGDSPDAQTIARRKLAEQLAMKFKRFRVLRSGGTHWLAVHVKELV